MVPLLADENVPFPLVAALRVAGADVRTAREAGLLNTPDPAVLTAATAMGRAVLTQDRVYIRLHKRGANHAGVVYATVDNDFAALAARVLAALVGEINLGGRLVRICRPSIP